MSRFHKPDDEKRSVVVIEKCDFGKWLNATHEEASNLLKLSSDGILNYTSQPINIPQQTLFE